MTDFEKQAMQARLDLAERQITQRIEALQNNETAHGYNHIAKSEEINLHLVLSTITGKPNKFIEF